MKKLIKKYVLTAIVINIVAIVYGTIFNFILSGENASILFSYVEGLFVGFLVVVIYLIMAFACGYCFDQEELKDVHAKRIFIFMNLVAGILTSYGITILIGNNEWSTFTYVWMYILNLLFSGLVILKANYDGKKIRQALK